MTDQSMKERISVLEEQGKRNMEDHAAILAQLKEIKIQVTDALANKADKTELDKLSEKVDDNVKPKLLAGLYGAIMTGLVMAVVYFLVGK